MDRRPGPGAATVAVVEAYMTESPNVAMALSSRPENVALVREVLAGLSETLDLGGTVEDIKAAVSEACNNVVMHAYGGHEGRMEIELRADDAQLEAVVRDFGVGIGPRRIDDNYPGRCIGLAVIDALAATSELRSHGAGVEVAMRFDVPAQPEFCGLDAEVLARASRDAREGALEIAIAPLSLAAAIFNRVIAATAARAGFSIDRLSDAQIVADALAAHIVPSLATPHVRLEIAGTDSGIELRVGPLQRGGSLSAVADSAIADVGPIIERLTDEVVVVPEDGSREMLSLRMRDRRPRTPSTPP